MTDRRSAGPTTSGEPEASGGPPATLGLNILMVAPEPFFRIRGTPFSILHRIRALASSGHRVDLVTYPFGDDVAIERLRISRARRPPWINDVRIGPSLAKQILDFSLYRETVRALEARRYDVLHSHEEAAFFAVGLARRYGLPHVYDMHSSLPQQLGNFRTYDHWPVRALFARLERWAAQLRRRDHDLSRTGRDRGPGRTHGAARHDRERGRRRAGVRQW